VTIPKQKRAPLVLFGLIVLLFFAGYAIFGDIGSASVPGDDVAVVEEAPAGLGDITREDFDRALDQAAAAESIRRVPEAGDPRYEQLKEAALNNLLDLVWIQGEAADLGVEATPDEVSSLLRQTISQNFRNKQEFDEFREQSNFTEEDIRTRIKLQILSNKIQENVIDAVPKVTGAEISEYYDSARDQFIQPATRDVRLVLNRDQVRVEQAKQQLEADDSDATWQKVASQFSSDPSSKSNGGLRPSVTEGLLEEPLNGQVFDASTGEIVGPVKTPLGYYVFQVEKTSPERVLPLDRQARAQIRSQLVQTAQQNSFSQFVDDFGSKWRARTTCAEGFVTERCDNFVGGLPAAAPPACFAANPPRGQRPADCPAPVAQLAPALPGSISIVTPQGNRLPQRPVPAGAPAGPGLGQGVIGAPGAAAPAPAP
jgi:parvulin-like peptidyl-prolyl isomerase